MWSRNLFLACLLVASVPAQAGDEVALGRKLMAENGCNGECHAKQSPGGDPAKFFTRPNLKVTSLDGLKQQAMHCAGGAQLSSGELDAIVAALNADYYKFK